MTQKIKTKKPNAIVAGVPVAVSRDIKPMWLNVARRFQSVAHQHEGQALIHMVVVVNEAGTPVFWTSPELIKIEPKREDIMQLIESGAMTEADLAMVLSFIAGKV